MVDPQDVAGEVGQQIVVVVKGNKVKRVAACLILLLAITTLAMAEDIEIVAVNVPTLKEYPDVPELQSKVRDLYNKILSIKKQPKFSELGFGAGYPDANMWKQDCMKLRDSLVKMKVPDGMKDVAVDLMNLGDTYLHARHDGLKNLQDLDMHEEAIYNFRSKVAEVIWADIK